MPKDQDLRDAVRKLASEGRVNCKALLDLAAARRVSPAVVGRLCNELNIRICNCQLGCFR